MADETSTSPREETALPGIGLPPPRLLRWEIVTVFAVSLGASGIYDLVQYIGSLTAQQSLSKQAVIVHGTLAPGRPLLSSGQSRTVRNLAVRRSGRRLLRSGSLTVSPRASRSPLR